MAEQRKCKLCGNEVIWARSALSRGMICLQASTTGTYALVDGMALRLEQTSPHIAAIVDGERYVMHQSMCPEICKVNP